MGRDTVSYVFSLTRQYVLLGKDQVRKINPWYNGREIIDSHDIPARSIKGKSRVPKSLPRRIIFNLSPTPWQHPVVGGVFSYTIPTLILLVLGEVIPEADEECWIRPPWRIICLGWENIVRKYSSIRQPR